MFIVVLGPGAEPCRKQLDGCSCKSAAPLLVERSHGEGSFATICNAPLAKGWGKFGKHLFSIISAVGGTLWRTELTEGVFSAES